MDFRFAKWGLKAETIKKKSCLAKCLGNNGFSRINSQESAKLWKLMEI